MRKLKSRPPHFNPTDYIFFLRRHVIMGRCKYEVDDTKEEINVPPLFDLLKKLKDDFNYSFISFQNEFIDQEGISCLIDVLRTCQNRQSLPETQCRPQHLKKFLNEEFVCLLTLKASSTHQKALDCLINHATALSTLACSIMSNFLRTRIVALELLTKCCKNHINGPNKLLEAMSSVKLIFGESVRFKFLVSMLNGGGKDSIVFQRVSLSFINTLLESCCRSADRVRIQCELEEAGFDINCMEDKFHECKVASNDRLWVEVRKWKEMYLDVQLALREYQTKSRENVKLLQEISNLRNTIKRMEEDKMNLLKMEKDLKEKCDKLHQQLRDFKHDFKSQSSMELVIPEMEEENGTDSGCYSNDKEECIRYSSLSWKYPPLPQPRRTVVHRSRSSERKQTQLPINRSKSENRTLSAAGSKDKTSVEVYKHYDGFFFKPNVRFSDVTTTSIFKSNLKNSKSELVHKEIAKAVKEIGGWL